jgi:hypothetical protein
VPSLLDDLHSAIDHRQEDLEKFHTAIHVPFRYFPDTANISTPTRQKAGRIPGLDEFAGLFGIER